MIFMIAIPKNKKILFFSPHPDDDVMSSGALIYTLVKNKNKITCIYFTFSPKGVARNIPIKEKIKIRKGEAKKACKVLGSKPLFLGFDSRNFKYNKENVKKIINLLRKKKPDIIFIPPKNDVHPTHKKVSKIVLKATEYTKVKEKWFYETWTPLERPNFIFFFNENLMKIKINALKQHKTQIERMDFITSIKAFNIYRGIMGTELLGGFGKSYKIKKKYGEAFLVIK